MFTFKKFLKMQSIFVFPGNVYLLMMLFLFVALCTTTLSDKIEEKANGSLKDNANVDANVCFFTLLSIFQANFLHKLVYS